MAAIVSRFIFGCCFWAILSIKNIQVILDKYENLLGKGHFLKLNIDNKIDDSQEFKKLDSFSREKFSKEFAPYRFDYKYCQINLGEYRDTLLGSEITGLYVTSNLLNNIVAFNLTLVGNESLIEKITQFLNEKPKFMRMGSSFSDPYFTIFYWNKISHCVILRFSSENSSYNFALGDRPVVLTIYKCGNVMQFLK